MKKNNELNYKKINEVVTLTNQLLKIFYVVVIIGIIFLGTLVFKEWRIMNFLLKLFKVCSPLFIGIIIAWLLNPIVTWLEKKGFKRVWGSCLIFLSLIGIIMMIILTLIPLINGQLNDVISMIPVVFNGVKDLVNGVFDSLNSIQGVDVTSIENNVFTIIEGFIINTITNLPNSLVNIITSFFSGIGIFLISLVIGFYMLLNFNNINGHFINLFSKKKQYEISKLIERISIQLYNFVQGSLISSVLIFIECIVVFMLIGLKAPILFALFCAITNVIPYVGPYIGAAPALLVGFSQSTPIGILVGVMIMIIQTIDANLVVPLVMSKKLKLHPVSIIVGLLVFGYFFGIGGMILATPIIAVCKELMQFIISKYNLFDKEEKIQKIYIGRKKDDKKV